MEPDDVISETGEPPLTPATNFLTKTKRTLIDIEAESEGHAVSALKGFHAKTPRRGRGIRGRRLTYEESTRRGDKIKGPVG